MKGKEFVSCSTRCSAASTRIRSLATAFFDDALVVDIAVVAFDEEVPNVGPTDTAARGDQPFLASERRCELGQFPHRDARVNLRVLLFDEVAHQFLDLFRVTRKPGSAFGVSGHQLKRGAGCGINQPVRLTL